MSERGNYTSRRTNCEECANRAVRILRRRAEFEGSKYLTVNLVNDNGRYLIVGIAGGLYSGEEIQTLESAFLHVHKDEWPCHELGFVVACDWPGDNREFWVIQEEGVVDKPHSVKVADEQEKERNEKRREEARKAPSNNWLPYIPESTTEEPDAP